jgi:hypothetical protein
MELRVSDETLSVSEGGTMSDVDWVDSFNGFIAPSALWIPNLFLDPSSYQYAMVDDAVRLSKTVRQCNEVLANFFANPSKWWDNQFDKPNLRGPDFKHKLMKTSLWINSNSIPEWMKCKLRHD